MALRHCAGDPDRRAAVFALPRGMAGGPGGAAGASGPAPEIPAVPPGLSDRDPSDRALLAVSAPGVARVRHQLQLRAVLGPNALSVAGVYAARVRQKLADRGRRRPAQGVRRYQRLLDDAGRDRGAGPGSVPVDSYRLFRHGLEDTE